MTELVAINGLGGLEYLWDAFRAARPLGVGLRVRDLPGHGDRPPADDYHYSALVRDVTGRTADLEPFPLLGWSVGAEIAAALPDVRVETVPDAGHFMVREQPETVARLVLDFLDGWK